MRLWAAPSGEHHDLPARSVLFTRDRPVIDEDMIGTIVGAASSRGRRSASSPRPWRRPPRRSPPPQVRSKSSRLGSAVRPDEPADPHERGYAKLAVTLDEV